MRHHLVALATLSALGAASPACAQSLKADEVLSSIAARPVSAPNPVLGADGRVHLAYELFVANPSKVFVTLDKVEILDPGGRTLSTLADDALGAMTSSQSGGGRTLPPGGTAVVLLDVALDPGAPLPAEMRARLTARREAADKDGKPEPLPAGYPLPAAFSFTGAPTGIGQPAVVVEPPLRGNGWVAVNGCCDSLTSHRGAVMAVNGQLRTPERFAIDWVQLDPEGRLFSGDVNKLESYAFFGTPVHAAADGVVVNLYDAAGEQVPGQDATGITPESVGGNMLVIDMGGGAFAFYAHLKPGSLKVKLGDKVTAGEVIALLGNTGNSTGPHLHFHVMDGPSPLDANGLPFVLTHFTGRGVVDERNSDFVDKPVPAVIDKTRLVGERRDALPLNNQVTDFDP